MAARYAIYFVPGATTALYRFGASLLGYDCYSGRDITFPSGLESSDWPAIVREPRVYGFHATLKAPFRLADGKEEHVLKDACTAFGRDYLPVKIGALTVRELGSFVALVPKAASSALHRLAGACVEAFDHFRAPPTRQERERRVAAGLSWQQAENLDRWGYPFVFSDFRFHMTLSGPLDANRKADVLRLISEKYEQRVRNEPVIVDEIVISRQVDATAPFQVLHRASLGHSPMRPYAVSF